MKKILIAASCLFLSACTSKQQSDRSHLYVKCWEMAHDIIIYSGMTGSNGVGMGVNKATGTPFVVFRDEQNEQIVIDLTNRVCAVVATE